MSDNVIPSIGVSEGPSLIVRLYDAARAVKVHKSLLSDLARHSDELLSTVREYSPRFVGTDVGTAADEIESAIEDILERVLGWSRLDKTMAFVKQNEIRDGIEECRRELTTCTDRFSVALSLIKNSESQEREMARQRGHQQLVDMIAVLLEEVRKIGQFKTSEVPQLREQLLQTQVLEVDGQGGIPQVASSPRYKSDHSGRISRVSEDAVIEGSQLDFYIGEWTNDGERTALGRLKDQYPDSQKRFKEWIEASLSLQHRNILNFFGHVTIDDTVYSVNPLMENGNMRQYIQRKPDADRLRLLREVASGVEFLHESDIVHGDLCDKNVLINRNGKAIVCGFDLFKFSKLAESRIRWISPERNTPSGVTSPTEKADIWSFGLLCLEVFTGKDPYHSYSDQYVSYLLIKGTQPEHPGSAAVGLSENMWDLMQSCWQCDTALRPSMSEIQSTIRDMLPPRDPHQQPGNMELPILTPLTPTVETASPNEATRTLSPLSPLTSPTLIEISPVLQEPNILAPTAFPRTVDQQIDAQSPIRRRRSDSPSSGIRRLPPLPEHPHKPDIPAAPVSASSQQPTTSRGSKQRRPSTAPNSSSSSSSPSDLRRQLSVDSSSSQSTSSTSGSNKQRLFPSGHVRSQTTPDTSPSVNSDTLPPSTPSSGNSFILQGAPPATRPSPNRSRTMPVKKYSKMMARQPSRSNTTYIDLPQSRKWEPVSCVVLDFMERAASDSECLLRFATDGAVSAGNLEGLVSRVISDIAASRDDHFRATFLTIYQLFATSERLFSILKRRFESTELDPITVRSRYPILLFIESWLKKGFEDGELNCSSMIKEVVVALVSSKTVSETMEAKAREIANLIEDPDYVRLRQPKKCSPLRREAAERPPGLTPADLAAALTVVEGDRFKCITYWDYVNFTRQRPDVRRIEVFNIVHDLVTVWVQTSVLHSDFLEERMKMYEEWVYTAEACRGLNNFSSTSAIVIALMSPIVTALVLTCESKAKQVLYALAKDLTPTDGVYQNTLQKAGTTDLIPWLDPHLSTLNASFAHSIPVVEVDGHYLIDFKQCSQVAEQIESLVQYSPPRTRNTTRPDVLAYVESSLKSRSGDDTVRAVEKRSANLAGEEQSLLEHRKKMKSLGFAWSPPRRK